MLQSEIYCPVPSNKTAHQNSSLLNIEPRMPKCPSAWVSKYPSAQEPFERPSARVPKSLKGQVPKCLECPSAQVPFECPSVSSVQVPKCLECPSDQVPFECLSALSASSASSVRMPWDSKCLSKSVSHSAAHSAGLQCWLSKFTFTVRANFATEETSFNF